jgi:hypothetical protein
MTQNVSEDQAVSEPASRTFHGVSGETLIAGHDEDGVMIRTEFRSNKLSAFGARELATQLIECAELAEAWMAEAAGMSPPEPQARTLRALLDIREDLESATADLIDVIRSLDPEAEPAGRCDHGPDLQRCILTAGHPGTHDPGPDPDGHGPDCRCRYCLDEPEPEYRPHEPEPWT